jgi:hypothetical protein
MYCADQERFRAKLAEADAIEGYPHYYQRSVVEATIDEERLQPDDQLHQDRQSSSATDAGHASSDPALKKKVKCFIYHRQRKGILTAYPVRCGDWSYVAMQVPTTPTRVFFSIPFLGPNRTNKRPLFSFK